jgi:hypothetical protein
MLQKRYKVTANFFTAKFFLRFFLDNKCFLTLDRLNL